MKRYARFLAIGLVLVAWATTADAQQLLKQSTAATVRVGPFLDEDDGKTAETALTVSQADVRLSKAGGAFAQKNETSAATHDENGWYSVDLDATDTGTLGQLTIAIHESGALPVWQYYTVVTDAKFAELTGDDAPVVTYVVHDGNDITSGTTLRTKLLAAPSGSTIIIVPSSSSPDTFDMGSGTLDTSGKSLTVIGPGMDEVVIQADTAGDRLWQIGSDTTLRRLSILTTDAGASDGQALVASSKFNLLVDECRIKGNEDGIKFTACSNVRIVNCHLESNVDPVWLSGSRAFLVENNRIVHTGIETSTCEAVVANTFAGNAPSGTIRNCSIELTRTGSSYTGSAYAMRVGGSVRVNSCQLVVESTNALDDQDIGGVFVNADTVVLSDSTISTTNAGSGSEIHVDASTADTKVILSNCDYDPAKLNGVANIKTDLTPLVAGRALGVNASGHVERVVLNDRTTENTDMRGTEGALLATSAPANFPDLSITAGTGLVTTDAASRTASQADVSGLATPAEVKSQADAAIETYGLHYLFQTAYDPSNKPGDPAGLLNVLVENDGGVPRLTANALEEAPSGGSGSSGGPVELRLPARMFTWKVERRFDGKVVIERAITVAAGEQNVFLGFDCEKLLDPGDYLKTMTAPTATGTGVTPETTAGRYGHDRTIAKLYVDVDPPATPGDRTIETTVTTENGGGPYRLRAILTVAD